MEKHESKKSLEEIFQETKIEKVDTVDNLKSRSYLMQWLSMFPVLYQMCVMDSNQSTAESCMLWVK